MAGTINILLSTYNGQQYLAELLNSLLAQTYEDVIISVRDDGSTDATRTILKSYMIDNRNISIDFGNHLGVIKSFFTLLINGDSECEYFAFCDQDDVWNSNKLEQAVSSLSKISKDTCAMYCSNYVLVDEQLRPINRPRGNSPLPSFFNAVVENIASGCTIVINGAARAILLKQIPEHAIMHDWWIYLVVSAFGEVIYDPRPTILYRQHRSNLIGVDTGFAIWRNRLIRYRRNKGRHLLSQQVEEFNQIYGSLLTPQISGFIDLFLRQKGSFLKRLNFAFSSKCYRNSLVENVILKLLYVFNHI